VTPFDSTVGLGLAYRDSVVLRYPLACLS
jgi:hypothetical protein